MNPILDAIASQAALPARTVWLNGSFQPLARAQVSVLDRGFLFGDGIYEVVPAYSRRPFALDAHLDRLERSLAEMRLTPSQTRTDWHALIQGLIEQHPEEDQTIYLQVTRGAAPKRDHAFPASDTACTVLGMSSPLSRPTLAQRQAGLKCITAPDPRWSRCDIKSIALLGNVLTRQAAVEQGCDEAILLKDGHLTDGAASTIWVVKAGVLLAPPPSGEILEGIRLQLLDAYAQAVLIPHERRPISEALLKDADEVLLTSATKEVLPICTLDGQPVGSGQPGPVYRALQGAYDAAIEAHRQAAGTDDAHFNFPCEFPVKIMGAARDGFSETLAAAIQDLTGPIGEEQIELRKSAGGNYLSLTIRFTAHSRAQLDAVYQRLTGHPWVKVVL